MEIPKKTLDKLCAIFHEASFKTPYSRVHDRSKELYTDGIKAAIEALGVIILPVDAEPMIGDLVWISIARCSDSHEEESYHEEHTFFVTETTQFSDDMDVTILKRNGKPVIVEEK